MPFIPDKPTSSFVPDTQEASSSQQTPETPSQNNPLNNAALGASGYGAGALIKRYYKHPELIKPEVGAFATGAAETGTMGYLPQLQGAAQTYITDPIHKYFNPAPAGTTEQPTSYVENRDAWIARNKDLEEKSPMASLAGKATGIVGSTLAGGAALKGLGLGAEGLGLAGRTARNVALGGAQGFTYNPGDAKGVVDPIQAEERSKNAKIGAALEGALPLVGEGVAAGGKKLGGKIMESAAGLSATKTGKRIGEKLVEMGIPGFGKGQMAAKATEKLAETKPVVKSIVNQVAEPINVDTATQPLKQLKANYVDEFGTPSSGNEAVVKRIDKRIEGMYKESPTASTQDQFRENASKKGAWAKRTNKPVAGEIAEAEYTGRRQAITDAVNKQDPALAQKYNDVMAQREALHEANKGLTDKSINLKDLTKLLLGAGVRGGVGYEIGGVPGAVAGAAIGSPTGKAIAAKLITSGSKNIQGLTKLLGTPEAQKALLEYRRKK